MTKRVAIFIVSVDAKGVILKRIKRGRPGYRKGRKRAIIRQRDAIELFRKMKKAGKGFDGSYVFQFLETAGSFAMLALQAKERDIQDNLDQILAYDGSTKQSGV